MRCVKEVFLPVAASCAFSALRRASSTATATSRNEVAVGTASDSVMFWTSRAAGPVMGVRPAGRGERGEVLGGAAEGTSPFSPLSSTSARLVGITGSSASRPLSNSSRHASGTEAGSRRYCSYITCTNAALWVPTTKEITGGKIIRRQTSDVSDILAGMKRLALLCLTFVAASPRLSAQDLFTRVVTRIAKTPNTGVGVYYRRLDRPDSVLVDAGHRFHAASTMKVPVMIQVFRDADAGTLRLGDSLTVVNEFHSIVDGSPYQLDKADDSDSSLYLRVGEKAVVRDLLDLMITVSSNLATDILIERVGAARANATAHALGADSILVLRGVEDGVAYRAGRNNTTTARDLGVLLAAIAEHRAASRVACDSMLAILGRQHFTEGIPAGLPPGARVFHKTGWVGQVVYHDAAYVELPGGRRYVLAVTTGGIQQDTAAYHLVADVSRMVVGAVR